MNRLNSIVSVGFGLVHVCVCVCVGGGGGGGGGRGRVMGVKTLPQTFQVFS